MKKIFVPTDFSDVSKNAVSYAIALAKENQAEMVLFHAFHVPVSNGEMPVVIVTADELEKENLETLCKYRDQLVAGEAKGISIECIVAAGFAAEEIPYQAKQAGADMIVMGITGGGPLTEVLIGSNTTSVVSQTELPVLVVPKEASYTSVAKIAVACDFSRLNENKLGQDLSTWANRFKAHLDIVNVIKKDSMPTIENALTGIKLEQALSKTDHKLVFVENEDMVKGLNEFIADNKTDLLIMLPKKHNLFERIFKSSNTKHMTFHSKIPVLALHV